MRDELRRLTLQHRVQGGDLLLGGNRALVRALLLPRERDRRAGLSAAPTTTAALAA